MYAEQKEKGIEQSNVNFNVLHMAIATGAHVKTRLLLLMKDVGKEVKTIHCHSFHAFQNLDIHDQNQARLSFLLEISKKH